MESNLPVHPPTAGEQRERMQRVRVGLTGLAAVGLIVMVATAVATGVRRSASETAVASGSPGIIATTSPGNSVDPKTEPLAQLGVAPDAKESTVAAKPSH